MFDRSAIGYLCSFGSEICFGGAYILDFLILHKKPEPLNFQGPVLFSYDADIHIFGKISPVV